MTTVEKPPLQRRGAYVYTGCSLRKAIMLHSASSHLFVMSHVAVANDAVCGHRLGTQATKRTPIWAGGLSTAGGESRA